ncbi:D-lactate dehydrogenase (cytochrome) [Strigomonas culicis]|uniref:D-lactate dehydrogenase (cytochrome) n=1 Tax=Strigomonas culicis TaxID=28005 RepID=S9UE06_9TRYP|nr:D-lactate dehydrogenase (cytochrome) [Strigomonas culicis]|eukprot:EPY27138.1 D-lactate dehydrogenase (cytochrome) [Strigomonas culicis]
MSQQPVVVPSFEERQKHFAPFLRELATVLPDASKQIITAKGRLRFFSKDQSPYPAVLPLAVVAPRTTEEVAAVMRCCHRHHVKVTPRGAGTGLEGGAIPYGGGIVLELLQLKTIEFDLANGCVWAGAGVKKLELNEACAKHDRHFGPDPASNPCVGGMVSTSGSGMSTLRYGTTRENVITLTVVNYRGEVFQTRPMVRKSASGLELTQLYIGSEGTLGVVTKVCFRLFAHEKYSAGAYAAFEKTEDAVRAVVAMRQQSDRIRSLVRCEMLNGPNIESTNQYSNLSLPTVATVLLEFTSRDRWLRDAKQDYKVIEKIFKDVGRARVVKYLKAGRELDHYWSARRNCLLAATRFRKKPKPERVFTADICVPLTKLTEIIAYAEQIFEEDGKKCLLCAHISDANFHVGIPFANEQEFKELTALEHRIIKRAIELGGTVSGEHGIGVGKVHLVTAEHGATHIGVQEKIKAALDPANRLNAGTFYPCQQQLYPLARM